MSEEKKPSDQVYDLCEKIGASTRGPVSELLAEVLLAVLPEQHDERMSGGSVIDALRAALDFVCAADEEMMAKLSAAMLEIFDDSQGRTAEPENFK